MLRHLIGHLQHLGSHNALKYRWFLDLFSRGPEDDILKVETCRPDNILIFIYIKLIVVLLPDTIVFMYFNTSGRKTLKFRLRNFLTNLKYSVRILNTMTVTFQGSFGGPRRMRFRTYGS